MKTRTLIGLCLVGLGCGWTGCDLGDENVGDEHATESDGDPTSGDSGDSGSPGDGSDGSSGVEGTCEGYPFGATVEEIAATPREDADAELLALLVSGQLTAPQALYERVSDDLAAIRAQDPMLVDHHARSPWDFGSAAVSFDEAGTMAMQAGTYDGWDCPNDRYGVTPMPSPILEDTAFLSTGDKQLHMGRLAEEYRLLPNVIYTEPGGSLDGSYICLEPQGDLHRYLFARGGGDCPAGCTEWDYWEYSVDAGGVVTFDGQSTELPDGWADHCGWG